MIDPNLNKKKLWIEPGIGNFGGKNKPFTFSFFGSIVWGFFLLNFVFFLDRYFGTEEEED
jgi:hypothetical protein